MLPLGRTNTCRLGSTVENLCSIIGEGLIYANAGTSEILGEGGNVRLKCRAKLSMICDRKMVEMLAPRAENEVQNNTRLLNIFLGGFDGWIPKS